MLPVSTLYVNTQTDKKQMTLKSATNQDPSTSFLNKQTRLKQKWTIETDLLKNTGKFTFFHIVEGKLKHAILCISILFKQIKSGLVQIKPHKLNIARQTPKTFKKSYSVLSPIRHIIRDYLVFDDILKSANSQSKPQLLLSLIHI